MPVLLFNSLNEFLILARIVFYFIRTYFYFYYFNFLCSLVNVFHNSIFYFYEYCNLIFYEKITLKLEHFFLFLLESFTILHHLVPFLDALGFPYVYSLWIPGESDWSQLLGHDSWRQYHSVCGGCSSVPSIPQSRWWPLGLETKGPPPWSDLKEALKLSLGERYWSGCKNRANMVSHACIL